MYIFFILSNWTREIYISESNNENLIKLVYKYSSGDLVVIWKKIMSGFCPMFCGIVNHQQT